MLSVLGLDDLENRLYERLLDVSSASADRLAPDVGADVAEVVLALAGLEARGLVARSSRHPDQVTAAPPDVGLGSLIAERQAALRRAQQAVPALVQRYRQAVGGRDGSDVVDVVLGAEAVAQRAVQLQHGARREVLTLLPGDPPAAVQDALDRERAVPRGVEHRLVVARAVLEQPGLLERLTDPAGRPEQVRVATHLPLRLLVTDRALALVPLSSGSGSGGTADGAGALLVRPSGLLDALVALFDLVWQRGHRVVGARDGGAQLASTPLDALDLRILTLLLSGLTDQSIGKQLGLSLRTVQRRARALMDATGVSTRLQLGYEVARRGWV
ncbi:LuxR family transcriptional regulator [Lapillicoccus jejuensis]|uniref:Sugar-specific transcriptional regulator TrmB n=1 Tax=Lapillicoccus jejuensis TaxID=402171 RepID=A0A542E671_9MICO|nr:sugar-specific transcriptional regulator TrmB [Lapillicoccus jejuensis]